MKEIKSVKLGGKSMKSLLFAVGSLWGAWLLGVVAAAIIMVLYFCLKGNIKFTKSAIRFCVWNITHPFKSIRLIIDSLACIFMNLDDLIFRMIVKHRYNRYQKRMNRVKYEKKDNQEKMKEILEIHSEGLDLLAKGYEIYPSNFYTPRKVVYKELDDMWIA